MVARGFGGCIQAIELVESDVDRLRKLREYVNDRPDNRERRRAIRLIGDIETGLRDS